MTIGKKEIKLLIVLGFLIYALLFYLIFINNYIPDIKDVNNKLSVAKKQEKVLKEQLQNIEEIRSDFNSKIVINERVENFLLENGDITDGVDYMEKLERLMYNKLTDVSISKPVEKLVQSGSKTQSTSTSTSTDEKLLGDTDSTSSTTAPSGTKYYEMAIAFNARLAYSEVSDLLNYIEGATRRVRISSFSMEPIEKDKGTGNQSQAPEPTPVSTPVPGQPVTKGPLFRVAMTINLYSINAGDMQKLYGYGSNKFGGFDDNYGLQFTVGSAKDLKINTNENAITATAQGSSIPVYVDKNLITADFTIRETGYYTAGENLHVYGIDYGKDLFRTKTSGRADIQLLLDGSSYKMYVNYASGKTKTISGTLPNRDLSFEINAEIPKSKENDKIRLNIKIVNKTSNNVKINLIDNSRIVKIMDRTGAEITGDSSKEKVSIG